MGENVFFWHLLSPSPLNLLFCNEHDLWIELCACLERCLLKRRTTVPLSDMASRTYARVEPISSNSMAANVAPFMRLFQNKQVRRIKFDIHSTFALRLRFITGWKLVLTGYWINVLLNRSQRKWPCKIFFAILIVNWCVLPWGRDFSIRLTFYERIKSFY